MLVLTYPLAKWVRNLQAPSQFLLAPIQIVSCVGWKVIAMAVFFCYIMLSLCYNLMCLLKNNPALSVLLLNLWQTAQYIVGVSPTSFNATQLNSCFWDNEKSFLALQLINFLFTCCYFLASAWSILWMCNSQQRWDRSKMVHSLATDSFYHLKGSLLVDRPDMAVYFVCLW